MNSPDELGEHYNRRAAHGLNAVTAFEREGQHGSWGEDHLADAKQCLADLDTVAVTFDTLNVTQARELFAGLHRATRNRLAAHIHDMVHRTQAEFSDPCDDPDCPYTDLSPDQADAHSALNWMADLIERKPSTQPTLKAQQGLKRALDEAIASSTVVAEVYAEYLASKTKNDVDNSAAAGVTGTTTETDASNDDDGWPDDTPRMSRPLEAARERVADTVHNLAHRLVQADPSTRIAADTTHPDGTCGNDDCSTEMSITSAFHVRQRQFRPQANNAHAHTHAHHATATSGLPDASDTGQTATPENQAADEFGTHMPHYQRGRAWATAIHTAIQSSHRHQLEQHLTEADRLLGPLGNLNHPEDLRDFIAGSARQFEDHLDAPR